jgi:hypothetical protein
MTILVNKFVLQFEILKGTTYIGNKYIILPKNLTI